MPTLADNLIATIEWTQLPPPSGIPPWAYGSVQAWCARSQYGSVYVVGSYCCPQELTDPDHHCQDGRGTSNDILTTLGLVQLVGQPATQFVKVTEGV